MVRISIIVFISFFIFVGCANSHYLSPEPSVLLPIAPPLETIHFKDEVYQHFPKLFVDNLFVHTLNILEANNLLDKNTILDNGMIVCEITDYTIYQILFQNLKDGNEFEKIFHAYLKSDLPQGKILLEAISSLRSIISNMALYSKEYRLACEAGAECFMIGETIVNFQLYAETMQDFDKRRKESIEVVLSCCTFD